jgi:hypothetical protein
MGMVPYQGNPYILLASGKVDILGMDYQQNTIRSCRLFAVGFFELEDK